MHILDDIKNNSKVTAATIFTLAIITMTASIMATAPAAAATTKTTEAETTTPAASSLATELSPEPVYQERQISVTTPINQTHTLFTDSNWYADLAKCHRAYQCHQH